MARAESLTQSRGKLLPYVWLFLATIQIKMDNEEAWYPFFRLALFLVLPAAALYCGRSLLVRARFTLSQWFLVLWLVYLVFYPIMTIFFGGIELRNLKDAAYMLAIFMVLFYLLKRYFTDHSGRLEVAAFGRFLTNFAMVHSVIAILMLMGLILGAASLGFQFQQMSWLDGRLHGLLGTPSHFAPVIALAWLFLLTRRRTLGNTILLGGFLVIVVMTGSRGTLLGMAGAVLLWALVRTNRLRFRLKGAALVFVGFVLVAALAVSFGSETTEVLQMAFRSDPADWEKSRPVMWALRLAEFSQADPLVQLFGAGHRAIGQTFNSNVEYLVNYGLIYMIAFNVFYVVILLRLVVRARRSRDPNDGFVLMIAVFLYLFSQGINYTFHQFVHIAPLAMHVVLISYFERRRLSVAAPGHVPGTTGSWNERRVAA